MLTYESINARVHIFLLLGYFVTSINVITLGYILTSINVRVLYFHLLGYFLMTTLTLILTLNDPHGAIT